MVHKQPYLAGNSDLTAHSEEAQTRFCNQSRTISELRYRYHCDFSLKRKLKQALTPSYFSA